VLAVDEHCFLRAELSRLVGNRRDVLVLLPEIGGERVRDRAVLAHPRERAARVESAGEGDSHPFADRQRAEDDATRLSGAHRWLRRSPSSSAGVVPSAHATKTVLSPA